MKTSDVDILFCADRHGLGDDHWVQRWARNLKTGQLVEVEALRESGDNDSDAAAPLVAAVASCRRPVVLVGYHVGVARIARHARELANENAIGALLVAPPELELVSADDQEKQGEGRAEAAALTNDPLPFPSLMVASRSDPRCSFERASELALAWGSHLVDAGEVGQLDDASGHGPWPEGLMRLGWFLKRLG